MKTCSTCTYVAIVNGSLTCKEYGWPLSAGQESVIYCSNHSAKRGQLYSDQLICSQCVHRYRRESYASQHSWCKKIHRQALTVVKCPNYKQEVKK